jgi:Ca2+:H+ antiporter
LKILQKIFFGLALLFIPLAIILDKIGGVPQPLLFFLAAVAIFPLAALLVHSTEQLATYTGDTIGGLLNATFGNAPELIIALVALKAGLYDMVKASIIGAILANMLLALGAAFLAGGLKRRILEFNPTAARNYMTMMLLAVISLAIPSTFHNFVTADTIKHEQYVNLAVAVVLLFTYFLSLVFMLKTHPDLFESTGQAEELSTEGRWSLSRAALTLLLTSVFVAFMSEILVGAVEETAKALDMSQAFIGIVVLAVVGGAAAGKLRMALAHPSSKIYSKPGSAETPRHQHLRPRRRRARTCSKKNEKKANSNGACWAISKKAVQISAPWCTWPCTA